MYTETGEDGHERQHIDAAAAITCEEVANAKIPACGT
jgi:hypothetical protein